MYDDKIVIFYNTGENNPTVIKRKDTEELISHLNDIASNGKTATNDCPNATGTTAPPYKRKTRLNLKSSNEFHLAGMNRAISNCMPFMMKQNIYWLCLFVENNDVYISSTKKHIVTSLYLKANIPMVSMKS